MPTDSHLSGPSGFDPEAASLAATLARVRLCRRVRRSARASVVLLAAAFTVWLTMPAPKPGRGPELANNPLIIHSVPLTAQERIVSAAENDLYVRTPGESVAVVRFNTSPEASEQRLDEAGFHRWLAANKLYCIQLGTDTPVILPLTP
jgi:hypothetical protein